ncbi:aspartic peptidase domain-containing protein [Rhypophila decipiens]|uniref:Aspartic peptidase domain-containing protein n=1 Tax=Rhypophila decipiens TaxID=261697 RepID=A0AAN6YLY9_9PEZI|nr:aspartic peptidase domain-containing protein [Rhypophila decipiens]
MRVEWSFAVFTTLFWGAAVAQNVLEFNLNKGFPGVRVGVTPRISRRDTHVGTLVNNITGGAYYIDALIGTPGQRVSMILDTGSSDAWVVSPVADLCRSTRLQEYYQQSCYGTYSATDSKTFELISRNTFDIMYLDGGGAAGDFIADDFTIAGTTIKSLQMGYAKRTSRGTGILGIGFNSSVSADKPYPNIIDELQNQGKIATKAYSLYLNDRRSDTGSILFGGIDRSKFIGPLTILPILKPNNTKIPRSFEVEFTSLTVESTSGPLTISAPTTYDNSPFPAVLDSGSTLSYIPDQMAQQVFKKLGVITDTQFTGLSLIDCAYLKSNLTMTFQFLTAAISVPVWEMVLDHLLEGYEHLIPKQTSKSFSDVCIFGLQSTGTFEDDGVKTIDFALLGETFLRSAYVVYDLTHHEIGMAQANMNETGTDIVEFKSTDKSIPTLTGVAAQQTTNPPRGSGTGTNGQPDGTGSSSGGGGGPATHTVTVIASPDNNAAGYGSRQGLLPGGGGGEALAVLSFWCLFAMVGGAVMVL